MRMVKRVSARVILAAAALLVVGCTSEAPAAVERPPPTARQLWASYRSPACALVRTAMTDRRAVRLVGGKLVDDGPCGRSRCILGDDGVVARLLPDAGKRFDVRVGELALVSGPVDANHAARKVWIGDRAAAVIDADGKLMLADGRAQRVLELPMPALRADEHVSGLLRSGSRIAARVNRPAESGGSCEERERWVTIYEPEPIPLLPVVDGDAIVGELVRAPDGLDVVMHDGTRAHIVGRFDDDVRGHVLGDRVFIVSNTNLPIHMWPKGGTPFAIERRDGERVWTTARGLARFHPREGLSLVDERGARVVIGRASADVDLSGRGWAAGTTLAHVELVVTRDRALVVEEGETVTCRRETRAHIVDLVRDTVTTIYEGADFIVAPTFADTDFAWVQAAQEVEQLSIE